MIVAHLDRYLAVAQASLPVRADSQSDFGWPQYIPIAISLVALLVSVLAPWLSFRRRPDISLAKDESGIHTRLEGSAILFPWVRLLIRNSPGKRVARGVSVLVEYFRESASASVPTALGHPELGWPSVVSQEGNRFVFSGAERPIDFGYFLLANRPTRPDTQPIPVSIPSPIAIKNGAVWCFCFTLAMHAKNMYIADFREYLWPVPGGYVATLCVGADDGNAHRYNVWFDWNATALDAEEVLAKLELIVGDPSPPVTEPQDLYAKPSFRSA